MNELREVVPFRDYFGEHVARMEQQLAKEVREFFDAGAAGPATVAPAAAAVAVALAGEAAPAPPAAPVAEAEAVPAPSAAAPAAPSAQVAAVVSPRLAAADVIGSAQGQGENVPAYDLFSDAFGDIIGPGGLAPFDDAGCVEPLVMAFFAGAPAGAESEPLGQVFLDNDAADVLVGDEGELAPPGFFGASQ